MTLSIPRLLAGAALALPLMANAVVYQFNASLAAGNEVGFISNSTATGIATLSYNDMGTMALNDDTFNFSMAVFGLDGGSVPGTAASIFHIHGAASATENATVRVFLDAAPFVFLNSGSTLLVGGSEVPAPLIPATPMSGSNAGYLPMSFLSMLTGGLAYVNVHTAGDPSGAVRGQLMQVAVVPEPETYALLLAGLGLVGAAVRRRKAAVGA